MPRNNYSRGILPRGGHLVTAFVVKIKINRFVGKIFAAFLLIITFWLVLATLQKESKRTNNMIINLLLSAVVPLINCKTRMKRIYGIKFLFDLGINTQNRKNRSRPCCKEGKTNLINCTYHLHRFTNLYTMRWPLLQRRVYMLYHQLFVISTQLQYSE